MDDLRRLYSLQMQDQYNRKSSDLPLDIARKREMDTIMLNCFGMSSRLQGQEEIPSGYMNQHLVPNNPVGRPFAFPNSAATRAPSFYGKFPDQYHSTVINRQNHFNEQAVHRQQFNYGLSGAPSQPMHLQISGNDNLPNSRAGYMLNHIHQQYTRPSQLPVKVSSPLARSLNWHDICNLRVFFSDILHSEICCLSHNRKCGHTDCLKGELVRCHIQKCRDKSCGCIRTKELLSHFKKCRGHCELCKPVWAKYSQKWRSCTKRKMPDPEINAPELLDIHCKQSKIGENIKNIRQKSCNHQLGDLSRVFSNQDNGPGMNLQEAGREPLIKGNCMQPSVQVMETIREKPSNFHLLEPTSKHLSTEDVVSGMNLQEAVRESLREEICMDPSVQVKETIRGKLCSNQLYDSTNRSLCNDYDEPGKNLQEEGTVKESLTRGNTMDPSDLETNFIKNEQEEELCENINASPSADEQDKELIIEISHNDQNEEMVDRNSSEAVDSSVPVQFAAGLNETRKKRNCASLINSFTSEEVKEHILDVRQTNQKSRKTRDEEKPMEGSVDENCCSLCGLTEITFEKSRSYCSYCRHCIRKGAFYTIDLADVGGARLICKRCYTECYKSTTAKFEKMENSATNELWVQCDKCKKWQHQICALFNDKKNEGDQAEYTCANCYVCEIESTIPQSLAKSDFFEAKQLPRTKLSDHIEQWLSSRLEEDRQKRANDLGKNINQVVGAEALVVRVVSSVSKKVKVMDSFRKEFLKDNNYPEEFPYNSKVILLFQKIGGVDVCLFAAYVQEYDLDCPGPNQRRVYLSYIDSVNYFRPRTSAATGESLRTYVYHEILIGYLDYCSKRGFTHCHLWVYPPGKNDDFILYDHPDEQKMPSVSRLRQWYHALIRKAKKENIAVDCTNLYDQYFKRNSERNIAQFTLPYFDGDFLPKLAGNIFNDEANKRNTFNGSVAKKMKGKLASSSVVEKFEYFIRKYKKDNIIIKLRPNDNDFPVHERCHEITKSGFMPHMDGEEEVKMFTSILDTRVDFLSLCEENNYRFNTLRRAKHSTMMIIQHLYENALTGT